jgi:hypothetical protein
MFIALIAPELIVIWAARQRISARNTAKDFNDAFGTHPAKTHDDHQNIAEEGTATTLTEMPRSDERHSKAAGIKFTGRLLVHTLRLVVANIQLVVT